MLDTAEGIGESCLRVVQASNVAAQQEVSSCIERVPEEHVHHIHFTLTQLDHEFLHVLFEDVNIAQPVLDKLGADQLS